MRKAFRFFFHDSDGAAIDETSLTVEDLPLMHPFPLGICIRYRPKGAKAAQIRPIGRCRIRFLADDEAPGVKPQPNEVALDKSNYDSWKTVGRLIVELDAHEIQRMESMGGPALVRPTRLWFWPVRITSTFLFTSLTTAGNICRERDVLPEGVKFEPNKPLWRRCAIAAFLGGRYCPRLEIAVNDPALDDAARVPMPEVERGSGEQQQLYVCAAHYGPPLDGFAEEWDYEKSLNPSYAANGAIPAPLAYQALKDCLVDVNDETIRMVRDEILLRTVPFTPLRFTRTWLPVPNRSKHFPNQMVVFKNGAGVELHQQALPSHGVLWVPKATFDTFPVGTVLEIKGGMRWLPFTSDVWLMKGERTPLKVEMPASDKQPQHIILRLPMKDAMLADLTRPEGGDWTCTYFSMRRAVRAWIDNRICGGRLSQEVNQAKRESKDDNYTVKSDAVTVGLLRKAFDGSIRAYSVANNMPSITAGSEDGGKCLMDLMRVLFPLPTKLHPLPNGVVPDASPERYTQGEAAYWLWQTAFKDRDTPPSYYRLKNPKFVCNYSDDDMGRGAAGAIVLLGVGAYHNDSYKVPPPGEPFRRIYVEKMIEGLEPGAVLRIVWNKEGIGMNDYRTLVDRRTTGPAVPVPGHSPIFTKYVRDNTGMVTNLKVIDQNREHDYAVDTSNWNIGNADFWVAANWTE